MGPRTCGAHQNLGLLFLHCVRFFSAVSDERISTNCKERRISQYVYVDEYQTHKQESITKHLNKQSLRKLHLQNALLLMSP